MGDTSSLERAPSVGLVAVVDACPLEFWRLGLDVAVIFDVDASCGPGPYDTLRPGRHCLNELSENRLFGRSRPLSVRSVPSSPPVLGVGLKEREELCC